MTPQNEARRAIALTYTYDVFAAAIAMIIAVEARWRIFGDYSARPFPDDIPLIAAVLFAIAAAISFYVMAIHRQVWRHIGMPDGIKIFQAVILAALLFVPMMFVWNRLDGFPRTSLLIGTDARASTIHK